METGATTAICEIFNHVSRVQKESPPLEASQMREKLFFFFFAMKKWGKSQIIVLVFWGQEESF